MGAKIYKSVSDNIDKRFNEITSISYISNKVRAYDETGRIYISKIDDIDALTLEQTIENKDYVTMLYCFNGKLMELDCLKGEKFSSGDGAEILDAKQLSMEYVGSNLLKITVVNDNAENELFINIHCK
jgi:hypothetical protein